MSNNSTINSNSINATNSDIWQKLDVISFWNYGLQNQSIVTSWEWFWLRDIPNVRINMTNTPQGHGQILNDVFFWWREISVSWYLKSENKADLDLLIDEFKFYLSRPNEYLRHKVSWYSREILATVSKLEFWEKNNMYISFDITFLSQDAFWSRSRQQSFMIEELSDNERDEWITNWGKNTRPLIIMSFKDNISWTDTIEFKVWGVWIKIEQSISDKDLLVIDGQRMTVKHNWTILDYTWVFPEFENWYNETNIKINWDFTVDINVIYKFNIV